MSAWKRSSLLLLPLGLAICCLLAIFAIMDASSADASRGEFGRQTTTQPSIIIAPTELNAVLQPGEQITQTLWITNSGDSDLTFSIYEISGTLNTAASIITPASDPLVDPVLQSQVDSMVSATAIIFMRGQADLSAASLISDKLARRQFVYHRLLQVAAQGDELYQWLENQGCQPQRLVAANAIIASLDQTQLAVVAANSQVKQIRSNQQYSVIASEASFQMGPLNSASSPSLPGTVEWNIARIRANDVWDILGIDGAGSVVGIVDTGVMYNHPALVASYRGNLGDGNFDHNYSWFDYVNDQLVPYDDNGHGTMGTGIITGDDGAGNQIGVAPGARWIAVKACSAGFSCTEADLLAALEWMLAPTDLNGLNPDPSKAPDVVLNMWGSGIHCDPTFLTILQNLLAANILPVFAPGGSGPACGFIGNPADLDETLAAGATDQNDTIADFSARGPGCSGIIKPDVAAPGVNIRSSYIDPEYDVQNGTSWSAAHLAGTAALVFSADPGISLTDLEQVLFSTALCIDDNFCVGGSCPEPNNVYGHGRLDAYQAVLAAMGNPPPQGELSWVSETPISATLPAGEMIAITITFDATDLQPGSYSGALGILSDDPQQPFVGVPVSLEVQSAPAPRIKAVPAIFTALLNEGGVQTETLTISNNGTDVLTFTLHEVSSTQKLLATAFPITVTNWSADNSPALVEPEVGSQLAQGSASRLIIYLRGTPDLSGASQINDRTARIKFVYQQLVDLAAQSDDLYNWLLDQAAQPHRMLTANAIAATLNAHQLETLLSFPQVGRVSLNGYASLPSDGSDPLAFGPDRPDLLTLLESRLASPTNVEWNIAKIRADQVWGSYGIRGQGAVIGIIDTGVMVTHPALNAQYRGNLGDGNYDHNYNWFDLIGEQPAPYDDNGHGTFGMGIALGDDGLGNQIGVAPGAKWIAVKAIDNYGGVSEEGLHAALEWMLAPTDLDGQNPDPSMAPQVMLNMWRWFGCDGSFELDLSTLHAANILPVFAPGGEGPGCGLVSYPAASPLALSAGSTDADDVIAPFSARGPSCIDGGIKPDVVAPGVDLRSSTIDGGYQGGWNGTSFSTAHLAGAAALLFSADPDLNIDQLEQALFDTAVCHDDNSCGGGSCPAPNNTYGYGRIDVFEATQAILSPPYDVPWLEAGPLTASLSPGESITTTVTFNAAGLQAGVYTAGIAILSNDPLEPLITLPVTLTVTEACLPVEVTDLSYTPAEPLAGQVITFTATAEGTPPISYAWDFTDGNIAVGQTVTHSYASAGDYQPVLTTENACSAPQVYFGISVSPLWYFNLLPWIGR